ncbi:MAG: hypothetical protein Q7S04_00105 [Candidatus Moranbacteria bacterium]|nr:hypothetical protein [Candidatus Moranbacteria bacterium]
MLFLKTLVAAVFVFVLPLFVFAQTSNEPTSLPAQNVEVSPLTTSPPPSFISPNAFQGQPTGLSSCFDYYRFGSIQVSVSPSLSQVMQGSAIAFSGTVTNQNHYPIIDATVYIKIFHDRTGGAKNINGPDVVDWFPAAEHITLKADESKPLSFVWQVPYDADPGAYKAAMYVTASDRFELSGLVFTDDVTGSMESFDVVGSASGDTRFDKARVTINDIPFYFAAFPPTIAASTKTVTVSVPVMNSSARSYAGTLSWKLYYWDQLQTNHLIAQSSVAINLNPESATTVSYVVNDTAHAVYYLVGSLENSMSGAKSIIGVRFVREGVAEPRINAMGVSAYPPTQGATAFVCVHSTSNDLSQNARVELSVTPVGFLAGLLGPRAHTAYTGIIPGDIYALTAPIAGRASSFDLTAFLYDGQGALVDSVTIPYRCSDLGAKCNDMTLPIILGTLAIVVIIGAIIIVRRRHAYARQQNQSNV